MPTQMVVELPNGRKMLFGGANALGLAEVSIGEEIGKASQEQFKGAFSSLAELITSIEHSIKSLPHRPDKIDMEFGASLTADCDLWIVSGNGSAEFKVKLTWGKDA